MGCSCRGKTGASNRRSITSRLGRGTNTNNPISPANVVKTNSKNRVEKIRQDAIRRALNR